MKVFRFVVEFKADDHFDPDVLQTALRGHLAEIGIPLLQFTCTEKNRCECVAEVREFPNGFPYRTMIFSGMDIAFDQISCPITCIPPSEMRFEEM